LLNLFDILNVFYNNILKETLI